MKWRKILTRAVRQTILIIFLLHFQFHFSNCVHAQTESHYVYQIPEQLNDGWEVASLSEVGINTSKIESITHQILTEGRFEDILSMVIIKNGKLVHEAYSPYCQRNSVYFLASITKTVTSTLIGIAIDKGFIKSENSSLFDLLPQFASEIKDPGKKKITLKHIMTMCSGLKWFEHGSSYNDLGNSEHLMVDTDYWIRYVALKPLQEKPGTKFLYDTGGVHLLSAVIKNATGLHANEFAEKYLFHPLGIYAYQWNKDSQGYSCTGGTDGGVGLRARDLAKFGWLFFKDGTWKGKQIISLKWIKEATKKHIKRLYRRGYYGFNWFPGSKTIKGKTFDYVASFGYGGQTLYLVPELDLVLVFTCELKESNANVHIPVKKTFEAVIQ